MPMCNLFEHSDNYSDSSFKGKVSIIDNTEENGTKNGVKITVSLKYLSNFWRLL